MPRERNKGLRSTDAFGGAGGRVEVSTWNLRATSPRTRATLNPGSVAEFRLQGTTHRIRYRMDVITSHFQEGPQSPAQTFGVERLALPYHHDIPAELSKFRYDTRIALHICRKFSRPVFGPRFGVRSALTTGVSMPKATVNENRFAEPREHEIRGSGQVAAVQSESKAQCMGGAPHSHLGRRALGPHSAHQGRPSRIHTQRDNLLCHILGSQYE